MFHDDMLRIEHPMGYPTVETRCLYITWAWIGTWWCQTDGRTNRQTDRSP